MQTRDPGITVTNNDPMPLQPVQQHRHHRWERHPVRIVSRQLDFLNSEITQICVPDWHQALQGYRERRAFLRAKQAKWDYIRGKMEVFPLFTSTILIAFIFVHRD
uniref:Uncharacterized protein n=1 Tax=Oryza punctata TaxID=4537 RepID=A0A0E0KE85_ORYPU